MTGINNTQKTDKVSQIVADRNAGTPLMATVMAGITSRKAPAITEERRDAELDAMARIAKIVEMGQLVTDIQNLTEKEHDRTFNFVQEALVRQADAKVDAEYTAVEDFTSAIRWYQRGTLGKIICQELDYTENQWERLMKAYHLIVSVSEEIEAIDYLAQAG